MDIMHNIELFLHSLWLNIYIRWIIFYNIYFFVFYFIITRICKILFVKLVKKTKTNLDNEIYGKTRWKLKILWYLLWLNLIYKLYFIQIISEYFSIVYNLLVSIEIIIVYVIIHNIFKIFLKYAIKNDKIFITRNVANLIKILLDIFIISVFFLLILKVWWINITPLLASAGIFGLAIAMASKSIIENFLSGMILFADKSINVWDTIILSDGTTATVEEISVRTTKLKTFDGNIVIIPNSELLNERIVNKSLTKISSQKRLVVSIWISYGDDTDKAKELLALYLREIDGIDEDSLVVYVDALADWSVNITWKVMVDVSKWSYLLEKQVLEKVYKEFPKYNLNFPFPTYSIEKLSE